MAIAQPGYCRDCGKVSYASWDDAQLAGKMYSLFPYDKGGKQFRGMRPYWAHERVWHLKTVTYGHHGGAGTREARNARKKRWLKRSKRKKYLSAVARMLYQLIAKGQKLNG